MKRKDFIKALVLTPALLSLKNIFASATNFNTGKMKTVIHPASARGFADHGWLKAHHSFSFADYYNPERMRFGLLRVLNDDTIAPGKGFGTHPHDNMEIVTIPLKGTLEHKDSLGSVGVIKKGEVQIMSAGTGVTHSEYNHSKTEEVKLLQTWIFPKQKNIKPRYDQKVFIAEGRKNKFQKVVSPDASEGSMMINQDAYYFLGDFDKDVNTAYTINIPGNGVYLFVMEGKIEIDGNKLGKRDAIGIWEVDKFTISTTEKSELLLIELPMN